MCAYICGELACVILLIDPPGGALNPFAAAAVDAADEQEAQLHPPTTHRRFWALCACRSPSARHLTPILTATAAGGGT